MEKKKVLGYICLGLVGLGVVNLVNEEIEKYKMKKMIQRTIGNIKIPVFTVEFNKNFAEVISQQVERG